MAKWLLGLIGLAALCGAAGVMEAAAAAHAISDPLLKVSAEILIVNAAAVTAIGAFGFAGSQGLLLLGAAALLLGTLLFCGELSAHVFLGRKFLPLAAPMGGLLMIAGWLVTAAMAFAGMSGRGR